MDTVPCPDCRSEARILASMPKDQERAWVSTCWRVAVAALLLVALGLWRTRTSVTQVRGTEGLVVETAVQARPRLLCPDSSLEILLAPGARMEGPVGGVWELREGSCLVRIQEASGGERLFRLGDRTVRCGRGEILLSVPGIVHGSSLPDLLLPAAHAAGDEGGSGGWKIWVLEGSATVSVDGGDGPASAVALQAGEGFEAPADGTGAPTRRALDATEVSEVWMSVCTGVREAGPHRLLDGRSGQASLLMALPSGPCLAWVEFRIPKIGSGGKGPGVGLAFRVDQKPVLWVPDLGAGSLPSEVRRLGICAGRDWVTLRLDGNVVLRARREEFRSNQAAESGGPGLRVWDGQVEVLSCGVESLE